MSKFYTVVAYRSSDDPEALSHYAELAGPAIEAAGGRIIARGLPLATFEAGLKQRTVIVEWSRLEAAIEIYASEAYQRAVACLGNTSVRDIRIIEGAGHRAEPCVPAEDGVAVDLANDRPLASDQPLI